MCDITREWHEFQQCSELLRQKIADAQLLMRAIAASSTVNSAEVLTSEPPNADWVTFPASDFRLVPELKSVRSVWQEWKCGCFGQPSVEYMEHRFGSLSWVRDSEQRKLALTRAKIVQEIEFHLEHGRDLEEIFAVGALHLEQLGYNMARLAAVIQRNMEGNRATFFEDP